MLSTIFSQECTELNPDNYGDCANQLGFVWVGSDCISVNGCDYGDDAEFFFNTYEECDIICNNDTSLGDLNGDSVINIIDIVQLVNIVLVSDSYLVSGDLNFDNTLNIVDIVSLVNIILSDQDMRDTWQIINEDILTPKCANCHYPGSFYSETSNLVLTEDVSYVQLVNRSPDNNSALENGLTLLSNEGGMLGLLLSFFWEKININNEIHFYSEHPLYGEIMPLGGPFLTNGELDFIEDWIWAGAPETGIVADPLILNDESIYEPPDFIPLDPPAMGIQYHIGPFDVYPNTEREFLYYVPPIDGEYFIKRVEMSMAPGTHHFIAYQFSDDWQWGEPELYSYRDVHAPYEDQFFNQLMAMQALNEHIFVFGTQWPSWSYSFPDGVALRVDNEYGLDLNPHYFNYTNETIQGEVYFNIHTEIPQNVEHVAGILQLGNNNISLPAHSETTLEEVFSTNEIINSMNINVPNGTSQLNIFQLFSHAHQLMTRFDILLLNQNGEEQLIYTSLDYQHPPILELDPPLVINNGESLIARATYYNNTDFEVNFGLLSTDEMMLIFGLGYFE
tara:strand:+ start:653 stop:2338 length:1686 start_codon:yes stop_codon:yes gene_type:complete